MSATASIPVRVLAIALSVAVGLPVVIAGGGCGREAKPHLQYHCPMHPTYVAEAPGDCPICGMSLVPIEPATREEPVAAPAPEVDVLPGLAEVTISEEAVALAGVVTAAATLAPITRQLRTVGTVVPDETRVQHVHTKISGWVEKLFVGYTGQQVRRGEPILSIFSPELVASQEEYVQARLSIVEPGFGGSVEVREAGAAMAAASRRRLELLDVPRRSLEALERGEAPKRSVTLTAPVSGFVTAKEVFPGQQIDPGTELFTVTDLTKVWIEAAIYESEASLVRLGQRAVFTFPYDRSRRLEGAISYISPSLDTATRTLKVRFDFANPELALRPGMFVDVDLEVSSETGIVIPDSAIIDTGERQIVFVEVSAGRFSPRLVQIGARGRGKALVLSGIRETERVVTKGNFLLDSEARIRAAVGLRDEPVPDRPPHGDHP